MITQEQKALIYEAIIEPLELPESAYEKAHTRYNDLGEWFNREESVCRSNDPHIFSQGSFRLGTAIRPISGNEEYDLDLACELRAGIDKNIHTQEYLKSLIGKELEEYRRARGIKQGNTEKHRCWRLEYQDDLSFHMDVVPCIPEDDVKRKNIYDSMRKSGNSEDVAKRASGLTVSITDDRHDNYNSICSNWNISNPEGYAIWFESKMHQFYHADLRKDAEIDDIPLFKRKTPLQRTIQLLKRHRDRMFEDNEAKPISIIITTLAAMAYNGEQDIDSALRNILNEMKNFVRSTLPRIPNPVNPDEDFADKWSTDEGRALRLEDNFDFWLKQAKYDFENLISSDDPRFIAEFVLGKYAIDLDSGDLKNRLSSNRAPTIIVKPKSHIVSDSDAARPWAVED